MIDSLAHWTTTPSMHNDGPKQDTVPRATDELQPIYSPCEMATEPTIYTQKIHGYMAGWRTGVGPSQFNDDAAQPYP